MDKLRLMSAEQQRLLETLHRTHDVRVYKRTLAVLECGRGRDVVEVARSIHVDRRVGGIVHRSCASSARPG
jgi:hypothetical protein